MNIGDLQQFVGSLATVFAKKGVPQADMVALGAALDPFKEETLSNFTAFLELAKQYRDTGVVPVIAGKKKKSPATPKQPKAGKVPLKTKADATAIQEAAAELDQLYNNTADVTYEAIKAAIKKIADSFDVNGLKEVARAFHVTSGLTSKKACADKIEHKISERKARNERPDAAPVPQPTQEAAATPNT